MRFQSGITDQVIYFVAVDSTDLKTRETTLTTFTVYRSRNGGTATAFTTPTVTEVDATNMPGVYKLLLDEDMTIDAGDDSQAYVVHITQAAMAPVTMQFELYRPIVTAGATLTVANGAADADIERIQGTVVSTPATAGILDVNVKNIDNDAASASGTVTFPNATLASTANITAGTITTVTNLTNAPTAGDLTATMKASVTTAVPTAAVNAAAVWDLDATAHQTQGTFGQAIGDPAADTNTIYGAVVTGAAGATVAADIIAIKAETAAILDDTDDIGVAGAGLTAINLPDQTMNITGDITGSLSGSVGSVTGAVGSVTGAVGSVTGAVGSVTGLTAATVHSDLDDIQARLPAALIGGKINATEAIVSGTADSGTTTTMVDAARTEADTDYWKDMAILFTSGTIAGQARLITGFNAATDTITFSPATTQAVGTNTYEIIPNVAAAGASAPSAATVAAAVWDLDATGHQTQGTFGQAIGDPVADTNTIFKAVVTDATGATVGVDVVAVKAETVSIQADTDNIQTRLPAALVSGRMDSSVGAMAADVLTAASMNADASAEIADAVWDEAMAGHLTAGTFGQRQYSIRAATAQAGGANSITLDASASATDAFYESTTVFITAGTGAGQARVITGYAGSSKQAFISPNWLTNPSSDSEFVILPTPRYEANVHAWNNEEPNVMVLGNISSTVAAIQFETITAAAFATDAVAEIVDGVWDEAIADHLGAGSTGLALNSASSAGDPWSTALPGAYGAGTAGKIVGDNLNATVSSRASQTSVDTIDDFLDTEIVAILAAVDTEVAAIKAKTDNLPATPAATGDAMTLTGAYDFAKGTVAMTESYAANGVAMTPAQALYAIQQMLMDFSIAGTSVTVKKLNNSTTAFVVTLDSATSPTAAART